ncbi:hypothetical protein E3N88_27977 [Mikania micrantha]|uniref:Large ribosomal subunit protein uL10-like insertion domain-containing protein n=1 Tax=Mikania micrantha TaxID=192012 RepID=A0A5N6MZ73_9ASTR|nr:hypothetical protein E3N88_27977 [Mikania micrantha]
MNPGSSHPESRGSFSASGWKSKKILSDQQGDQAVNFVARLRQSETKKNRGCLGVSEKTCVVQGEENLRGRRPAWLIIKMAKGIRGRRRIASRHCRTTTPYPILTCGPNDSDEKKSSTVKPIKDWEDITCSVCMEYPHNAVLLLCSSHDKGCRPYMCGTSTRYSNCLDQYKNAYIKVASPHHSQSLQTNSSQHFDQISGWPVEKCGDLTQLACPLCRGQVKGWTVVESTREYFNTKKRSCVHDKCSFVGVYKELKKHVRSEHLSVNPREVDPDQEQKWRRLERDRERDDVISTITSSMPGSMVFGDYVIEGNPYGLHLGNETGPDSGLEMSIDSDFLNMLLVLHAFGPVTLSKTKKKGREHKESIVSSIRGAVEEYNSIYVFSFENMRNLKFKQFREQLKSTSRFFLGSNKVMQVALGRSESDEVRSGLHKVSKLLRGDSGLCLTNMPVEEIQRIFNEYEDYDFARTGSIATETVELKEGPLDQFTHEMEPFLRKQGMPVRLNKGVVELVGDFVVCEEGNPISPEAARILRLMETKMATFKLHLICRWSPEDFEVYQEGLQGSDIESS